MRRFTAIVAMLLLTCMILGSCGGVTGGEGTTDKISQSEEETTLEGTEKNDENTTEEKSEDKSERGTADMTTEENKTEEIMTEEIMTEEITNEEITTEEAATENIKAELFYAPEIDGAVAKIPSTDYAMNTYVCGDGTRLWQYENMTAEDFRSACAYYKNEGFEMYCLNRVGSSLSATYTKGDAYYTLLFSEIRSTLYVEKSEKGAMALPAQGEAYEALVETTVTQGYSKNINGMTYVIRLADNSFIVVDGGYVADASNLYKTLKKLSGKESGIRIRAWIISHSHNDHYPAFAAFGDSYADKVNLECVMYAPVVEEKTGDKYFNGAILDDIAKYDGAKAVTVHAGMVFKFADVDFEILNTCEYIYKDYETLDLNESSTVCRVKNDEGSVIFLGDCYSKVSRFMIDTYGDGLKTEMMQVSHHGVEQATIELYDIISPSLAFWPCDEWLLSHQRGTTTKQYLLQSETIYEHVIHGYGNATRPLSYKAQPKEMLSVLSEKLSISGSDNVDNIRFEDGVLKYDVIEHAGKMDPFVYFKVKGISTKEYNAVRIVVNAPDYTESLFFFTCGNDGALNFSTKRQKLLGPQGVGENGTHTMILYLGNVENYEGDIKGLRIDIGTVGGQTVEIRSIEFFHLDIDK